MSHPPEAVRSLAVAKQLFDVVNKRGIDYRPQNLRYFSLLHLQNFIPESISSMTSDPYDPLYMRALHMQIYDLYTALMYAEKEILPKFTLEKCHSITPNQICTWIRGINQHAARTLLGVADIKSGEYSTTIVERWNPGARFSREFQMAWVRGTREDVCRVCDEHEISEEVREGYIDMIETYLKDKTIEIPAAYRVNRDEDDPVDNAFLDATHRYAIAYHRGLLAPHHRKALLSLSKICALPEEIPGKMEAYATTLLEKMKACNTKDENAVCELVSWAYYESTEIHPFPNGNGRTSTIFGVNCVLHAFGYPDILMRTPAQRNDPNSSYSIAIREIDHSRVPLTDHIKGQLKLARDKTLRVSDRKMQLVHDRVVLGLKLNYVLNNLALNELLNDVSVEYCSTYLHENANAVMKRYCDLFVTRCRTPEKYVQRLQEIANLDSKSTVWKKNLREGKFWVQGLTEQETLDTAARFNRLVAEHNANIGTMQAVPSRGIIMWTKPPYIELKALSKACTSEIDSDLQMAREVAVEMNQ